MPRNDADSLRYVYSPSIFIGGHARSGTTMMQGLICSSDDTIGVTEESTYFRMLGAAFYVGRGSSHSRDYFDNEKDLLCFHREIIEKYLRHVDSRFGPEKILVQKSPSTTRFFPQVSVLMPNARFVVMVRDFRDIIASQTVRFAKAKWQLNVDDELKQFVGTHERLRKYRRHLRERFLFVRYERLVFFPNETLSEIARYLNISLEDNIADSTWSIKRDTSKPDASPLDGKPVSRSRVGTYRSILDKTTLRKLEDMMPEISRRIGMDCFAADDPEDGDRFPNTELLV